jgi:hypothetical protein
LREKVVKPHFWGAKTSVPNSVPHFVDSIGLPENGARIRNTWHVLLFSSLSRE